MLTCIWNNSNHGKVLKESFEHLFNFRRENYRASGELWLLGVYSKCVIVTLSQSQSHHLPSHSFYGAFNSLASTKEEKWASERASQSCFRQTGDQQGEMNLIARPYWVCGCKMVSTEGWPRATALRSQTAPHSLVLHVCCVTASLMCHCQQQEESTWRKSGYRFH